ncbi:very long chain fatty acid elongase 7-like [Anticarsia gemmatalis]|uniref:very long chain fatty acid elongase 7-like n=1 Tax=Anticarsia gemmatalis TaxID=129554 RepID=UPI003F76CEF0
MAVILKKAWEGYTFLFDEIVDQRTKEWMFVAKPYQGIALLAVYLMFVLKWGPKFMKNRQPFNLDKLLIVYNAAQVAACIYLFYNSITLAWGWRYKWICEPVDFETPHGLEVAGMVYNYFLLKIIDLLDTVFFVLRKKFNQVSFLHIYHHTGMVMLIWGAVTYMPGGHGTLIGVINSFVHIVMYSYYLLTVAVPSIKNAVWIKKHVTQLQILQFFWCVMHMAIIVFKTDCAYPRWVSAVFLPQNIFMLVLFIDFYIKAYVLKPKEKVANNNKLNNEAENNNNYSNGYDKTSNENGIKLSSEVIKLNELNKKKSNLYGVNGFGNGNHKNNNYDENSNIKNGNGKLPSANGKSKMNGHGKKD